MSCMDGEGEDVEPGFPDFPEEAGGIASVVDVEAFRDFEGELLAGAADAGGLYSASVGAALPRAELDLVIIVSSGLKESERGERSRGE